MFLLFNLMSLDYYKIMNYLILFITINNILLCMSQSESRGHYVNEWAVQINGSLEVAKQIARKYGFICTTEILPTVYTFKHNKVSKRSIKPSDEYHTDLADDPLVIWIEQQFAKVRTRRYVKTVNIDDPKWRNMWYINTYDPSNSMNIMKAWEQGYTGEGVVVSILDDGIEKDHPDLKKNYDPLASYDIISDDSNPEPRYITTNGTRTRENHHGTRCAGQVAAARNNKICGVGVAYNASIGGIRMLGGNVTDGVESQSLRRFNQHIDIYSASWGPEDDGKTVDGPGKLAKFAFEEGILKGRNGLGSIFVWASGNGGKNSDNCNCDGYINSIFTLGVNAVSEMGTAPWYAEECSSIMAVTYSSGNLEEKAVITTDVDHQCTENHTGTSASAPFAAGIVALALSANRKLTWRDVQHLVVVTARKAGLRARDWKLNGVGWEYSHSFGFGLMDAGTMVSHAVNWTTVPEQHICHLPTGHMHQQGGPVYLTPYNSETVSIRTNGCAYSKERRVKYLEHVQAKISLRSSKRGEVQLILQSPSGTKSELLSQRPKDVTSGGFHHWPFMSVHFWGEKSEGDWLLTIAAFEAEVTLISWSLILYGTEQLPAYRKRHHYSSSSSSSSSSSQSSSSSSIYVKRPPKNVPTIYENDNSKTENKNKQKLYLKNSTSFSSAHSLPLYFSSQLLLFFIYLMTNQRS